MSEFLNEAKFPANIYHLSQDNLGGKILSPRIPSYLHDDENMKKNQDVGLYEENSIPRVSFSSDIQGCLRAIIPDLNANPEMKNMYLGKTLYVHIPENPYESYKRISNKEIIKNKYVFDAEFTKEEWVVEPVKLKCIGQIKILSISSSKNVKIDQKTNFRLQTFEYQWWTQNESLLNESNQESIERYKSILEDYKIEKETGCYGKNGIWNSLVVINGKNYRKRLECLIIKDNKVFLSKDKKGNFVIPGGSAEKDIDDTTQVCNECREEARIVVKNVRKTNIDYLIYEEPKEYMKDLEIKWVGKYTQIFIADYQKHYSGEINPEDLDENILNTGKFYEISKVFSSLRKEWQLALKDEVRKHLLESTNNEYYRVTYHGIGIYEALRNNVSNEEWRVILNNSQSIKWLPKPPNYNFNNRSYFTKLGYNTFNKKTLPLIRKYLNPNDIKTEIYNTLDGSIVYIDKYQIVVDVSNLHTDQDTISNRDKALEMKTFYEGYASDEVILQEMKRSILPDEVFGIPELRKYPMPDRKHVLSAIRFFNHVDYKYERQLAKRIIINMKKYNIDGSHVGKDNRLRKYLPKDMKDLAVKEIYEDDVHEDFLSQKSKPAKNQRAHVSYLKNKRKTHINNKATAVNTLSGNNSPSFQFQNSAAILHDDLFNYLIESENTKERKRPIFIVTSWTNTVFGKIISKWTKSTYTHAAIGFDTKLDKLYSYNADNKINKLGGFSVESIDEYRNIYEDSQICVSTFFVKESDFHKIKEGLDRLENNLKKTKYDFINILNIFFNRAVEVGAKGQEVLSLVCSEFVAWLISLADINIVDKPINLITPKDLSNFNNLKIYKLYEGYVRNYDKNKIDRIFNNLKKTANVIKESMIIEYMEMKKK